MPTTFDGAFQRVKELVSDFKANESFYLSAQFSEATARKQLSAAKTDGDKDFYSQKCANLDRQIDSLVYELYGLTEDEIKCGEKLKSLFCL